MMSYLEREKGEGESNNLRDYDNAYIVRYFPFCLYLLKQDNNAGHAHSFLLEIGGHPARENLAFNYRSILLI